MKALYNGCTFEFDLEGATYTDHELDVAARGAVRRLVEDQHAELAALRAEVERLRLLLTKSRTLLLDAVMHGMPITDDVLEIRNWMPLPAPPAKEE